MTYTITIPPFVLYAYIIGLIIAAVITVAMVSHEIKAWFMTHEILIVELVPETIQK